MKGEEKRSFVYRHEIYETRDCEHSNDISLIGSRSN